MWHASIKWNIIRIVKLLRNLHLSKHHSEVGVFEKVWSNFVRLSEILMLSSKVLNNIGICFKELIVFTHISSIKIPIELFHTSYDLILGVRCLCKSVYKKNKLEPKSDKMHPCNLFVRNNWYSCYKKIDDKVLCKFLEKEFRLKGLSGRTIELDKD